MHAACIRSKSARVSDQNILQVGSASFEICESMSQSAIRQSHNFSLSSLRTVLLKLALVLVSFESALVGSCGLR